MYSPLVAVSLIANAETKYDYVNDGDEKPVTVIQYKADGTAGKPTYIVDGKIASDINSISSDRIASMSVIKDPEAIAEINEKYNLQDNVASVIIIELKEEGAAPADDSRTLPAFQGGDMKQFSKWANMNIMYPETARKDKVEGLVMVQFIVDTDGSVTDARIAKSAHKALDAAVLKTVTSSPKWTPGMRDGKADKFTYILPVHFDIRGYNDDAAAQEATPKTAGNVFNILDDVYVTAY